MITASIEIRDGSNGNVLSVIKGHLERIPRVNEHIVISNGTEKQSYVVRGVSHLIVSPTDDASLISGQGVVITVT